MATRTERLVTLVDMIDRQRYPNVEKICEMFEIKPRTAFEDIRILKEQCGYEIEFDRFRGGYYNRSPKKKLPEFELTNAEVFALTLGKDMLGQYAGTSFEPILRGALEKIYRRLPDKVHIPIEELQCMVKFDAGAAVPLSRKMFFDLNRACEKNLPVRMVYYAAHRDETSERKVDAYRLLQSAGAWYMVGYCHMRRDFRMFALHRVRDYQLLDERFTPREDFSFEQWLDSAFQIEHGAENYRAKIRFGQVSARYIRERNWHASQILTEHEDGSCMLEFDTQSLEETKRWVMSYGADAEVLEPHELRELIRSDLSRALDAYAGDR